MKTFEKKPAEFSGSRFPGRRSGMSLAFVLMVMLIGGALTGAALWIVENATRTTRMAKQNAILYDATQEGIQRGLAALDELIGGFTSGDEMPGRSAVLRPKKANDENTWWQELLVVSTDMVRFSQDFTPSGSVELAGTNTNLVKGSWQIFTLAYEETVTGNPVKYVQGLPPKILVNMLKGGEESLENVTAAQTTQPEPPETFVGSFLVRSSVTSRTEKGAEVSQDSSLGLIRTRPKISP